MASAVDQPQDSPGDGAVVSAALRPDLRHQLGEAGHTVGQVLVLPETLGGAALARRWLQHDVHGLPAELREDAILLTSELVSNALQHGRPEVRLVVHVTPRSVRVAVADHGDSVPVFARERQGPTRQSGRGLFLVASLASGWGYHPHHRCPGKTVWFTL